MARDPESILIWDFDGTLGYREGMWSGALADLARRLRPELRLGPEAFRPHLQAGFPWHDWQRVRTPQSPGEWWREMHVIIRGAVEKVEGLAANDREALVLAIRGEYLRPEAWALYPDVMSFFSSPFAASRRHVILSNHVPELEDLLQVLGIRDCFEAVFNSSLTGVEKPHPGAFRQVLAAFPEAREFIMIGDSVEADIAPAEEMGWRAVLLRRDDPRARCACAGLDDLAPILTQPS